MVQKYIKSRMCDLWGSLHTLKVAAKQLPSLVRRRIAPGGAEPVDACIPGARLQHLQMRGSVLGIGNHGYAAVHLHS